MLGLCKSQLSVLNPQLNTSSSLEVSVVIAVVSVVALTVEMVETNVVEADETVSVAVGGTVVFVVG